jgi:hypothetical protein
MNAAINNPIESLNVWKKEAEQPRFEKQRTKTDNSRVGDSGTTSDPKDVLEVHNPLSHLVESNQASGQISIQDVDEAQKLLKEVVGLINSESEKSGAEEVFNLNRRNLVALLS